VDGLEASEVGPGNIRAELEAQGAGPEDLDAMEQALRPAEGEPSPVARFVLVRQGSVELDELLPGALVMPQSATAGPIPDLLPLIQHRPEVFPYVVAEVSRDNGEIRLHHAGTTAPATIEEVQGSSEHLHKFSGGGWSQLRFQHHTEEIWRRNADEVAAQIDRVVSSSGAKLVVLSGDIRARGLVQDQLSKAAQELVRVVDSHTHTAGADPDALTDDIRQSVAERWASEQQEILERLATQEGQANPESATGIGPVVHALQQAQVEVLILAADALSGRTFLALDAEPWVATAEEEALGAGLLGPVPAAAALLRAAALTDAKVLLVPGAVLPQGLDIAALLRWQSGPEAPSPV
jgi:hypothetical protein